MALEGRYWNRQFSPRLPSNPVTEPLFCLFSCVLLSRPLHAFTHLSGTLRLPHSAPTVFVKSVAWPYLVCFVKNGSPALCPAELQVPRCPVVMSSLLWVICAALPGHLRRSPADWTLDTCAHPVPHSQAQCRFPDLVSAWKVDWEFTRTQRHRKKRPQEAAMRPHLCQPLCPLGPAISAAQSKQEAFLFGNTRGQRWKEEKVQNQKDAQDVTKQGIPCVLSTEMLLVSPDGPLVPSLEIHQMLLPSPTNTPHTPKRQEFVNRGLSVAHLPMAYSWSSDWLGETGDPFPGRAVLRGTFK